MARKPTSVWHPARVVARRARVFLDTLGRAQKAEAPYEAALDTVRTRLQHYLRAFYGDAIFIEPLPEPKKPSLLKRVLRSAALVKERSASESDDKYIRLPVKLPSDGDVAALERYRLIAVQHAERMQRSTATHAEQATTDLERDLFLLAESASVDAQITESQPGLRSIVSAARTASLARRPRPRWRSAIELQVEQMFRSWQGGVNESDIDDRIDPLPLTGNAQASADWARRTSAALQARHGKREAAKYRRVPDLALWETTIDARRKPTEQTALETDTRETGKAAEQTPQGSKQRSLVSRASRSGSENRSGNESDNSVNDPKQGDQRGEGSRGETSRPSSEAKHADATENASHAAGAAPDRSSQSADEAADVGAGMHHSETDVAAAELGDAITHRYPEWDTYHQAFHPQGTVVRVLPPPAESSSWAESTLRQHMMLVHQAKQQFERLRSHRLRLPRQVRGDDLDLDACVDYMVSRTMGKTPSDRLYSMVRPGRRELAITLLIDVSGSTRDPVDETQRVIDVERAAALIATSAFDALGDDYSILSFSSHGANDVRVQTLKDFGDRDGGMVRRRIAALTPHGTTRLGAAVRHATALLAENPAPHRLLLIISDGKPYDYDWYFVEYAVQDSRRAIIDARAQGVHPFCITVDRAERPEYLAEIFGPGGYLMVRKPAELPRALLGAVQRLLA